MGTSCLALVWVMGRRRVPAPPERMRPFTGRTLLQPGTPPGTPCRGQPGDRAGPGRTSAPRQAEVAGDAQPLDLGRALADLQDLGVAVLPRHRRLVHEAAAAETRGPHP